MDFIELLINKIDILTTHSYIAKSQAGYLKKLKNDLKENEVIVLGDIAENYGFIVQDEIQGFHWNTSQCTLHPVVVYYKQNGNLQNHSLRYISDDLNHDVDFVYKVVAETIQFVKDFLIVDLEHIY